MVDSSLAGVAKQSVGWAIALSVLLILAGFLAIVLPPVAGIGVTIVVAWLLMLGAVAHLALAWHIRPTGGMYLELLVGLLYLAVAVYMLRLAGGRPRLAYAPAGLLPHRQRDSGVDPGLPHSPPLRLRLAFLRWRRFHHTGRNDRPELAIEQRVGDWNADWD